MLVAPPETMTCLIVGQEKLGKTKKILKEKYGVTKIEHWAKPSKLPQRLPKGTEMIILFSGYCSHELMWAVKKLAKANNLKITYVARGVSGLEQVS